MSLKNKVALVTGGSRDIGAAVSIKLASEGAKVVINYLNNQEQAEKTLAAVNEAGGEGIIVRGDMTKSEDVSSLVAASVEAFGEKIDVLVNVTGGLVARKTLAEMDEEFFTQVMQLNAVSTFLTTKAVVPHMTDGGSIVNLASQAGRDGGGPGACAYATSKGAVTTFTRSMAKELGPKGIRVNAVSPGMIATTFHDTFTKPEVRKNVAGGTPLRREGESAEVGDLVAYLASAESSFVNGANIDINGGTLFS